MIGKTDWTTYLHEIRKREIDMVFSLLPKNHFETGLEIGAGDGYQTNLISPRVDKLISSDLNFNRIKESLKLPQVEYKTLDADDISEKFLEKSFEFIFSSNVLEHLRDPRKFLLDTQPMLTDNGYAVHIIPSRHIKVAYLLFFYPNFLLLALDRTLGRISGKNFFQGEKINLENNINTEDKNEKKKSRWRRLLIPSPHGNFPSHWREYTAFGKESWEKMFKETGYSIVTYRKGPAFSGYGFGIKSVRKFLERVGVSSEHIFVLQRMGSFERVTREYTNKFLHRGSYYEKEKFIRDWLNKEKNAEAFLKDFKKAVGDPKDKKVLDVGYGNGIMLSKFAREGALVHGLETEDALDAIAQKQFSELGLSAELRLYDGKVFPFPDNTFDFCYSTSVLEHMSYPQEVFEEIHRTLVPGGKFYLSFPNKYAPKESHTGLWFISWLPRTVTQYILKIFKSSPLEDWNLHFISYFGMKKMAKKAGLKVVYDTDSKSIFKRDIKKVLALMGLHYGIFLKTVIIVLEKPNR